MGFITDRNKTQIKFFWQKYVTDDRKALTEYDKQHVADKFLAKIQENFIHVELYGWIMSKYDLVERERDDYKKQVEGLRRVVANNEKKELTNEPKFCIL